MVPKGFMSDLNLYSRNLFPIASEKQEPSVTKPDWWVIWNWEGVRGISVLKSIILQIKAKKRVPCEDSLKLLY